MQLKPSNNHAKKNTLRDAYDYFKYQDKVDFKTYREVCRTLNHLLMSSMIDTGVSYKLPNKMGVMEIRKYKRLEGYKKIDFNHLRKTGEIKRFHNSHSDGWYAKFVWNKKTRNSNVAYRSIYEFKPIRYYKRALARAIIDNNSILKYFTYD